MPRDAFVLKIQRELGHPKSARKVSGLSRNRPLILNEKNANNRQRRPELLLYLVGTDVQGIFSTLPNTGDAKDCKKAVGTLNVYFVPQVDTMDASRCYG